MKLHMHFIYYLHQLDSGILTESCFLRLGTGKACEPIRYNSKSASFRPFLSRYCIVFVDSKQAYNCTAKFMLFIIFWTLEKL